MAFIAPVALAPLAHAADPVSELAERYAPIVVVRDQPEACGEGEPYLPSPVEAVLGHPDVVLRGPDGQAIAAPTSADLAGKGEGWYLDLPGNPLSPGCDYETWFRSTSTQHVPTVYARVATDPAHPGMLALQYWFFWVFNDWNDRHEGDWEMVQLLFDADTAEAALAGAPASAAFAQHEGSETAAWTDDKLLRVDDRIVVYPGQGSHAAYYTQSQWFGKSAAAGFGCDDTTAEGIEVRPDVVVLPAATTPGFEWLDFTGRWGQQAPSFNNGPTGPNTKTQWAAPVTWQVEEGRDGAVALPVVGGPAVDSFCELTRAGSLLFIAALDQPLLVAALVLAAVVALVLLVRATRWRHGGDRQPDRERRAGQVVSASFGILFHSARALAPIMLTVGLATAGALALQRLALHRRPTGDLTDVNGLGDSGWAILLALLAAFALAPVVSVALAATCRIVEDLARRRRPHAWRAIGLAVRHPSGAIVQLVLFFVVTLLASSLFALPIALVLIAFWAVAMPAAVIEDRGVIAAFRRSTALTKGRRWRAVLLSALLVWIGFSVPGALGGLLLLVTGWPFWVSNVVAIVAGAILLPFSAIGLTLQYYDFRQEESRRRRRPGTLEQPQSRIVAALEGVVVEDDAADAPVLGQHASLGLDLLGREDARHGSKQRIAVQQVEVPGQLLHPVDLAAPLDLHRHRCARLVAAQQVHRPDRRRVLAPYKGPALAEHGDVRGEQLLQVGLDPVLHQARVHAEIVVGRVEDLVDADDQLLPALVLDRPHLDDVGFVRGAHAGHAGRAHPVERLVRAAVGVDEHGAVGLHHDQPPGLGQMRRQAADVVDTAPRHQDPHSRRLSTRHARRRRAMIVA